MKKVWAGAMGALLLLGCLSPASAINDSRGGVMGFIAGCCFGIRSAAAYNDGREIHWREWLRLTGIGAIWDGIEGAQGLTEQDYVKKYGAVFY